MKIIFLVSRPKKSIMVTKVFFLQDCFGIFDFWTFFLSIFEIPKILSPKNIENFEYFIYYFKVLKDRPRTPALPTSNLDINW